jgi:hypothetical protein
MRRYRIIKKGLVYRAEYRRFFIWWNVDSVWDNVYSLSEAIGLIQNDMRKQENARKKWKTVWKGSTNPETLLHSK